MDGLGLDVAAARGGQVSDAFGDDQSADFAAEYNQLKSAVQSAESRFDKMLAAQRAASERFNRLASEPTWSVTLADAALYKTNPTPLPLLVFSGALAMVAGSYEEPPFP